MLCMIGLNVFTFVLSNTKKKKKTYILLKAVISDDDKKSTNVHIASVNEGNVLFLLETIA